MRKNVHLLLFICIASAALISIDYYTIKILSAVRAYINGESEYSKGQKDASMYLNTYIETGDPAYLQLFKTAIGVPMADNLARKSLLHNEDDEVTGNYFLTARNHSEDVPNMIWLFKTFKFSFMKAPIVLWTDAEPLINQLYEMGTESSEVMAQRALTQEEKINIIKRASDISSELYKKESKFSQILGDEARKINTYLLWANIFCIIIIIGNISLYVIVTIRRLKASYLRLETTNKEITNTNEELDTLIYSLSHDLRSPITSIQGLVNISQDEDDIERLREYMQLIDNTVKLQDNFILEIIDFFKNKRTSVSYSQFSLKNLIDDIVDNNKYIPAAQQIAITKEITLDSVYADILRTKIIINNLVSNAIKYSDEGKAEKTILIKSQKQNHEMLIEITDNGIGIDKKDIGKVFDMFYVASNSNKGTGLGLYILRQNVEKLNGRVYVQSELNVGTKFSVFLPIVSKP